jgi:hypothetical protein
VIVASWRTSSKDSVWRTSSLRDRAHCIGGNRVLAFPPCRSGNVSICSRAGRSPD